MIVARPIDDVALVRSRVDEHVAAELSCDPVTIMSTISAEPFFPALVRDERGLAALTVLTESHAVADFYATRVGVFEILDSTRVTEIRTDWYALHESAATIRHVGDYLGVPPTGAVHDVHSVVLFPTDHDGIVGELEWTRVDFSKIFRQLPIDPPRDCDEDRVRPVARLEAARLHDRVIEAWLRGDAESLTDLVGDAPWAGRHVHRDRILPPLVTRSTGTDLSGAAAAFTTVDLVESPRRLQRYATSWFSFVELGIDLFAEGERRAIRLISLLALERGRVAGHLAYSVDVER